MPSLPLPRPVLLRGRSGLGLLIVALLLVQILVFGADTCPFRPGSSPRWSAAETAAAILQPSSAARPVPPAVSPSR